MNRCSCSRPVTDAFLCPDCTAQLQRTLDQVLGLVTELGVTAERRDATLIGLAPESKGTGAKGSPAPVNLDAVVVRQQLVAHYRQSAGDATAVARQPDATRYKHQAERLTSRALQIIDKEPERQHLGPCPTCGEPMSPIRGEYEHHCRTCGTTTIIDDYMGTRLGQAWAVTARPPRLVEVLGSLGVRVTIKQIKHWKARQQIIPAGEEGGHPTYRVADIYDIATRMAAKRKRPA